MAERNEEQQMIYALVDDCHQIFYIGTTGQLLNIRLSEHLSKARQGAAVNPQTQLRIDEITATGGRVGIVELDYVAPGEDWEEKEREWVERYQHRGYPLTNRAAGGKGQWGTRHTEESKQKISQSQAKRHAERKLQIVK